MNDETIKHRHHNGDESIHEAHVRALERLSAALRGLRFGVVTAVVHDGVVVSIERTEKLRLPNARES
jgi:hypothetical protein